MMVSSTVYNSVNTFVGIDRSSLHLSSSIERGERRRGEEEMRIGEEVEVIVEDF